MLLFPKRLRCLRAKSCVRGLLIGLSTFLSIFQVTLLFLLLVPEGLRVLRSTESLSVREVYHIWYWKFIIICKATFLFFPGRFRVRRSTGRSLYMTSSCELWIGLLTYITICKATLLFFPERLRVLMTTGSTGS